MSFNHSEDVLALPLLSDKFEFSTVHKLSPVLHEFMVIKSRLRSRRNVGVVLAASPGATGFSVSAIAVNGPNNAFHYQTSPSPSKWLLPFTQMVRTFRLNGYYLLCKWCVPFAQLITIVSPNDVYHLANLPPSF
jgi:hypothetical protein